MGQMVSPFSFVGRIMSVPLEDPGQGESMDMNEPMNFICRHCDVDFTKCLQVILFLFPPNQYIA